MGFTEHYLSGMMQSWGEVLGQHGYEHVKAEELARTVGMSVGTLYRRYGSKQRFAQEVRDFNENTFCQEVDWAFFCKHGADGVTFRQAFFVFWDALTRHALGLPRTFSFTFLHRHPEVPGQKAPGSEARALVREVLLKGEQDGALKPGCVRVGEALVWGTLAELVRALAERNEQVYQEDIRESAEALWRALAKTEDSGGAHGSGGPPDGLAQPESETSTGDSGRPHDGGTSAGVAQSAPQTQADDPHVAENHGRLTPDGCGVHARPGHGEGAAVHKPPSRSARCAVASCRKRPRFPTPASAPSRHTCSWTPEPGAPSGRRLQNRCGSLHVFVAGRLHASRLLAAAPAWTDVCRFFPRLE